LDEPEPLYDSVRGRADGTGDSGVEDDRYGAIVDEFDLHASAEHTRRDRHTELSERLAETVVERLGVLWSCCTGEVRSSSLLTFAIGDQGELADDKRAPALVEKRTVELAIVVLEDPQPGDAAREALGRRLLVSSGDPEQDEQPRRNRGPLLAVDDDGRSRDPLDDRSQRSSRTRAAYALLPGRSERASL
jgi:hypothetical protein